jgi:hypothetical protein
MCFAKHEQKKRDYIMDVEDLQRRIREETYRAQRTRTIDRDNKKLFLYHASADHTISAPSDADSYQKVTISE